MTYSVFNTCICGHHRIYDGSDCKYCLIKKECIERIIEIVEIGFDPFSDVPLLLMATIEEIKSWIEDDLKLLVPF